MIESFRIKVNDLEKKDYLKRLEELIDEGNLVKSTGKKLKKWQFNCETVLRSLQPDLFKPAHKARHQFIFVENYPASIEQLLELLESTKESLEKGLLGNLEYEIRKIEAKSLLDYAYPLLDENNDALDRCACVLSRITLEKTLQLLCEKHGVVSSKKANDLNQELRKEGIYSETQRKQITYLLDVGNKAAHPGSEWDAITAQQRRKAVRDIEDLAKTLI